MCSAQGVQPNASISIGPEGAVYNISTTSELSVVCPIVRDNTPQGGNPTSVVVRAIDRNPAVGVLNAVRCSLKSRENHGGLFAQTNSSSDATDEGGGFVLEPVRSHDNFGGFEWGYLHMQCILPRAVIDSSGIKRSSSIVAYEVRENYFEETQTQPGLVDEEL